MDVLKSTSYCQIFNIKELKAIYLKWNQYMMSSQFREVNKIAIELMKTHNYYNIISNRSELNVLKSKDKEWIDNMWKSEAQTFGFLNCTIIDQNDDKQESKTSMDINLDDLSIHYCKKLEEAFVWVELMNAQYMENHRIYL